ncbi:hypothetical protein [Paraburkholderia sacchari]
MTSSRAQIAEHSFVLIREGAIWTSSSPVASSDRWTMNRLTRTVPVPDA